MECKLHLLFAGENAAVLRRNPLDIERFHHVQRVGKRGVGRHDVLVKLPDGIKRTRFSRYGTNLIRIACFTRRIQIGKQGPLRVIAAEQIAGKQRFVLVSEVTKLPGAWQNGVP